MVTALMELYLNCFARKTNRMINVSDSSQCSDRYEEQTVMGTQTRLPGGKGGIKKGLPAEPASIKSRSKD